jgi:hypothetical protein
VERKYIAAAFEKFIADGGGETGIRDAFEAGYRAAMSQSLCSPPQEKSPARIAAGAGPSIST